MNPIGTFCFIGSEVINSLSGGTAPERLSQNASLSDLHLLDDLVLLSDVHGLLLGVFLTPIGEHLAHLGGTHVQVEHAVFQTRLSVLVGAATADAVSAAGALRGVRGIWDGSGVLHGGGTARTDLLFGFLYRTVLRLFFHDCGTRFSFDLPGWHFFLNRSVRFVVADGAILFVILHVRKTIHFN